jgi:two-component system LytT family response regulator
MTQAAAPLTVLIVDDEPMARATLRSLLEAESGIQLLGECSNGAEALASLRRNRPDLLFLDVEMPGMNGFEVIEALGEENPPLVVFTTAYDRYAIEAFGVHAVDYLLKPFDDERFAQALERARDHLVRERVVDASRALAQLVQPEAGSHVGELEDSGEPAPLERLTIRREGGIELVETSSIHWVESADQYVRLHTARGEILMRESMGALERSLDPTRFQRVHRSAIVALDQVRQLATQAGGLGKVQLLDETWVPVSRARIAALRRRLG